LDAVVAAASAIDGGEVVLTEDAYEAIRAAYGRRGLGDAVAAGLSAIGITEGRVARITGRPCNCQHRIESLNRVGESLVAAVRGTANRG